MWRASKLRPNAVELVGAMQKNLPVRERVDLFSCGNAYRSFGNEHQLVKGVTFTAKVVIFVKVAVKRAMKRQNISAACNAAVA